jgi:putative ABC transport system permease protein
MPLTDVHLRSATIGMPWLSHISNIKYIYIFGSIALFIVLLACVNFMNLSTARASKRAKEVGIRKVTGSTRSQLIGQFLLEAFSYSFLSSLIAVALVAILLKGFSMIIDEPINFKTAFSPVIWLSLVALTIIVGLLAGSYPALYLTSFKPVLILKGKNLFSGSRKDMLIRNGLVVFQFTISTIMIVGTLVVLKQLKFFRNTDMGFNKENVLIITSTNRLGESEESFRDVITQISGIVSASTTTSIPSGGAFGDSYKAQPDENVADVKDIGLNSFMVDESFIPTLGIKVVQGRNFSKAFSDSASIILNQEAVRQIGWKDPIGKWVEYPGGDNVRFKVIGVVKNFNIESLQATITPFALFNLSSKTYDFGHNVIAKVRSQDLPKVINQVESKWKSFASAEPFDYNFLDAAFDSQYRSEQRLGSIFSIFAALSIFIACLGLFGLSAFMAERRTKEIGVRKVLGASVSNVVVLLSKDFLRLTLIAIVIAFPVAWYFMSKWLEDFAYRINITWTIFLIAGCGTLIITLVTISFQAIGAAVANPVKSLRTE